MKKNSLVINAVLNTIRTMVVIACPIATFMYSSRIFLTEGVGQINFAKSYTAYFVMLAMLGIVNYGTREAAQIRNNRRELSHLAHELLMLNGISVLISYILFFLTIFGVGAFKDYRELLVINGLTIGLTAVGMDWLFSAVEDYKYITIRTCLVQGIGMIAIFVFVRDADDIFIYAIIQTLTATGANIFSFFYSHKHIDFRWMGGYSLRKHVRPVLLLFSMTLFIQVFTHMNTTMLSVMVGDHTTGLFTAANRLSGLTSSMITAVAMVFMPRIAYYVKQGKMEVIRALSKDAVNIICLLGIPASVGMYILSKEIILIFSGEAFFEAVVAARILAFRVLLVPLNSFIVLHLFIPLKKECWNLIATGSAAILNFFLNVVLIPELHQDGAALATVGAETIELVVNLYFFAKIVQLKEVFRNVRHYVVASLPIVLVAFLTNQLECSMIVTVGLTVIVSVISYVICLRLQKNDYMMDVTDTISKRLKTRS